MTSAEFDAKYRVLKTVSENGARSQIAQEIGLGRMVMVHHLDVGTKAEREWLLAQARSLDGDAALKVFSIANVDGTSVVVTHFLASFVDLPTWLKQHAGADLDKTQIIEAPVVPRTVAPQARPAAPTTPAAAAPPPAPHEAAAGPSFTAIFGKPSAPVVPQTAATPAPSASTVTPTAPQSVAP